MSTWHGLIEVRGFYLAVGWRPFNLFVLIGSRPILLREPWSVR